MIRCGLSMLLCAGLTGCATDFTHTPTAKLCMDYLAAPSYNVHRTAREQELAARREDCAAYVGAGIAQRQANDALLIEGARMLSTPPPRPIICTTTGNVTTCQ